MAGERYGRRVGTGPWNVWRGVVALGYLVAAAFNLFFTLPQGDLAWFAENAWLPVLEALVMEVVVPSREFFMVLVVAFEVVVGALILGRGRSVDVGVGAAVLWVLFLMPFLQPWPMAATNLLLAVLQAVLLLRRYETAIWQLVRRRSAG
jgi:hypothetical protein